MFKTCKTCNESLPVFEFSKNSATAFRTSCKRCHAEMMKSRRDGVTAVMPQRWNTGLPIAFNDVLNEMIAIVDSSSVSIKGKVKREIIEFEKKITESFIEG
jgi:hypothetical protein